MSTMNDRVVVCCDTMKDMLHDDDMITALDNVPFRLELNPNGITVYISSDGGHGGMAPIQFCPFCGTKIEIK